MPFRAAASLQREHESGVASMALVLGAQGWVWSQESCPGRTR